MVPNRPDYRSKCTRVQSQKAVCVELPDALPNYYDLQRRCGSELSSSATVFGGSRQLRSHTGASPGPIGQARTDLGPACSTIYQVGMCVLPLFVEAMSSLRRLPAPRGGGEEDRAPSFHCPGGQQGSHHGELPAASSPAARVRGGHRPPAMAGPTVEQEPECSVRCSSDHLHLRTYVRGGPKS
jgi:hypothetical protein